MEIREIGVWIVFIVYVVASLTMLDLDRGLMCEYSKYATTDYKLIDGKLYCRSSDNSYQLLTKPKARSKHLDEHKMEKK